METWGGPLVLAAITLAMIPMALATRSDQPAWLLMSWVVLGSLFAAVTWDGRLVWAAVAFVWMPAFVIALADQIRRASHGHPSLWRTLTTRD